MNSKLLKAVRREQRKGDSVSIALGGKYEVRYDSELGKWVLDRDGETADDCLSMDCCLSSRNRFDSPEEAGRALVTWLEADRRNRYGGGKGLYWLSEEEVR